MENRRNTRYGQVFKKYRKEAEISQAELADKMGVSRNTLINWEAGINFPDLDNVSTLCTILNIPLSELFGIYEKTDLKEGEREVLRGARSPPDIPVPEFERKGHGKGVSRGHTES